MSLEITFQCEKCKEWPSTVWLKGRPLKCSSCELVRPLLSEPPKLEPCPVCESEHTYRQKDFNRTFGILLLVIGIATSFFTYGLTLIGVTLFDWWLYRHTGDVGLCYRCNAQFRNSPEIEKLSPFQLSLHDYYKSLKK